MPLGNYLKDAIYDSTLRGEAFPVPTTLYLHLYTSDPGADDSGDEVVGGSYAAQAVTFADDTDGAGIADATVTYEDLPAATITHGALKDESGNLLAFNALTSTKTVASGDDLDLPASAITFALT